MQFVQTGGGRRTRRASRRKQKWPWGSPLRHLSISSGEPLRSSGPQIVPRYLKVFKKASLSAHQIFSKKFCHSSAVVILPQEAARPSAYLVTSSRFFLMLSTPGFSLSGSPFFPVAFLLFLLTAWLMVLAQCLGSSCRRAGQPDRWGKKIARSAIKARFDAALGFERSHPST